MASQSTESTTPNEENQNSQLNGSTNTVASPSNDNNDLSPTLAKKSYKSVLTKQVDSSNGQEASQTSEKKEDSTDSVSSIVEEQSPNQTTTEESTTTRRGSTSRRPQYNIGRGGQPWKRNNNFNRRNKDDEKEPEILADTTSWPSLDQVKVDTPTTAAPKEKKVTSPRDETTESQSSESPNSDAAANKKKAVNWVPLPGIELQSARTATNGAPRRGRGGRNNGHYNNNYQQQNQQNLGQYNNGNNRGNWRKPGQRGGMNTRGRGRGGYMAGGPVVYYTVPLEGDALKSALQFQIEYYFSVENLCRDIYLRQQMNEEGWIPISIIAAFNRVKALTMDTAMITEVLTNSTVVEMNGEKIRKKDDWKTWCIPQTATTPSTTSTPTVATVN